MRCFRCSLTSVQCPRGWPGISVSSVGSPEVGQNPQSVDPGAISVVLSRTVAYPHAGTIPHADWSLYGAGASLGTGYVSHLYQLVYPLKTIDRNIPMK